MISVERQNTKLWHRTNALLRLAVLRGATRPFGKNLIINEYPKSGGTWLSQMMAEATGLPFPRNRLPMLGSAIMQCHVLNPIGMRNTIVIWRDGRDVAVSFYHHLLRGNEFSTPQMLAENLRRAGLESADDIQASLPPFLEALFQGRLGPSFTWPAFVARWHGRSGVVETRYEDLLADTPRELARVLNAAGYRDIPDTRITEIADQYSFARQTGRATGSEVQGKFLRKGIAGDWKNTFTAEALSVFDHYAGPELRRLGYQEGSA